MTIQNTILNYCLTYLLNNKAPKTITHSSDDPKHYGFWVYLKDGDDKYVVREKDKFMSYKCTKFDPTEAEKDTIHTIDIKGSNSLFTNKIILVNLYYNGFEITAISPLFAYLYGITHAYKILKSYHHLKWTRAQRKHQKSLSHYKDRYRLLEALITIYEDEKDSVTVIVDDSIDINVLLLKLTNSNDLYATYASRSFLDPILRSLQSDDLIEFRDNSSIKINPKAWSELSKYIIEERRHSDSQNALYWQRVLMVFLVIGSLTTAFLTFIRPDVQNNIKSFFSSLL